MKYFHEISTIRIRFYEYVREEELERGYVIGRSVYNLTFECGLRIILEEVSDIHNADGEVVSGSDKDNQTECRF